MSSAPLLLRRPDGREAGNVRRGDLGAATHPMVQPYSVAYGRTVNGMTGMTTRAYGPSDAAAVTALMNVIDEAGGGRAALTVETTGATLSSQIADFSTDTRLTFAPDGALVAAGTVATPPTGGFRVDLFGGVHPDWRGQGLGRAVLSWQYERATQIHATTAPRRQWQAEIGVMAGEPTATRLFARLEFAVVRYFFEMLASTISTSRAALPAGLRSEVPTPGLDRPIFDAHVEAFADHWGAQRREFDKWLPLALHSKDFRPCPGSPSTMTRSSGTSSPTATTIRPAATSAKWVPAGRGAARAWPAH